MTFQSPSIADKDLGLNQYSLPKKRRPRRFKWVYALIFKLMDKGQFTLNQLMDRLYLGKWHRKQRTRVEEVLFLFSKAGYLKLSYLGNGDYSCEPCIVDELTETQEEARLSIKEKLPEEIFPGDGSTYKASSLDIALYERPKRKGHVATHG